MSLTKNDLEQINNIVTGAVGASEDRMSKNLMGLEGRFDHKLTGLEERNDLKLTGLGDRNDLKLTGLEGRIMKHMDARFEESALATASLVGGVLDHMDERFDEVDRRFDRLEGELRSTNRLVRKHSLDIMELRAAGA